MSAPAMQLWCVSEATVGAPPPLEPTRCLGGPFDGETKNACPNAARAIVASADASTGCDDGSYWPETLPTGERVLRWRASRGAP